MALQAHRHDRRHGLRDNRVGRVDGLILDGQEDRPLFLVVRRNTGTPQRFLVPVGDAWFDDTERAIRIDVAPGSRTQSAVPVKAPVSHLGLTAS